MKSEIQSTKSETNTNVQISKIRKSFEHWKIRILKIVSSFEFRVSSLSVLALDSKPFNIGDVFQPAATGKFDTLGNLATSILTILTSAAGVIAVFFIIIGGLKLITAAGDEKKMASAASTITYAIIGLVVTALAFVILQVVQYLLGAKVGTI